MSTAFQREDRYIVIKRKDLEKVPTAYRKDLVDPLPWLQTHLPRREFLVIESDWPEYELVWRMIEARVGGASAQSIADEPENFGVWRVSKDMRQKTAFFEWDEETREHVQNDSHMFDFTELVDRIHVTRLQARVAELTGLLPAFPPRPPEGDGLPRYGLRWNGPTQPLTVPMADGYWTPWHLAAQASTEAEELRRADECWAAVISYMLGDGRMEEPLEFLRCWNEGNFEAIRKEWPNAPKEVFYADPFFKGEAA